MDLPTMVSIVALGLSIGSLIVTIWATRISRRSLEHAIGVQERTEEKEFERLRTELLNQISDSRAILDKTRIEIGTLQANFQAEPQPIQVRMANYTSLFTEYLPKVSMSIQQLDALWADVLGWSKEKGHRELMEARAVLYRSIKDDETVQDSGIYMVNVFKAKLELAKQQAESVPPRCA
jgi:hypothetical protein